MRVWWVGKDKKSKASCGCVSGAAPSPTVLKTVKKAERHEDVTREWRRRNSVVSSLSPATCRGTHLSTREPRGKAVPAWSASLVFWRHDVTRDVVDFVLANFFYIWHSARHRRAPRGR